MPIRPIDIYTMAPKSQEASQIKQFESAKALHEQEQLSSSFKQVVEHKSQQTTKSEKGENKDYRYDAKEKGNNSYSGGEKKKKKKEEKLHEKEKGIQTSSFDMKI